MLGGRFEIEIGNCSAWHVLCRLLIRPELSQSFATMSFLRPLSRVSIFQSAMKKLVDRFCATTDMGSTITIVE
jgi:hypothetical protein